VGFEEEQQWSSYNICVILDVLGKDTWKLIFLEFSPKNIHFWCVVFFFSFFKDKAGVRIRVFFFFFFWQIFSPLVTKKRTFWKQIPKACDTLRKEELK